jgi:hypothetical protein
MTTPDATLKPSYPVPFPPPASPLLTVKQQAQQHPVFTEGGLRWAIFHADNNGLAESGAIVRMGRRVLIDPALFMAWIRTNPTLSPPKHKPGQKVAPRRALHLPRAVATLEPEAA